MLRVCGPAGQKRRQGEEGAGLVEQQLLVLLRVLLRPVIEKLARDHHQVGRPDRLDVERVQVVHGLDDDVPQRYEVMKNTPVVTDGYITVPELPGLGVDIDEAECAKHPSLGNINEPDA